MKLLERHEQLRDLHAALEGARRGRGSTVLVSGAAGIGKTWLLRAFAGRVAEGARVFLGTCEDLLTPRTLGPLRDMARDSGGALRRVGGGQLPRRGADRRPPLPPPHRRPRRPGGAAPGARGPVGCGGGPARHRGRARPRSGGGGRRRQPLLPHRGPRRPRRGRAAVGAPRRDGQVPVAAGALPVGAGAAGGGPTEAEPWLAAALLDDPAALEPAERRGMVVSAHGRIRFRHELARWVVELSVPPTGRVEHHRRALQALQAAGAEPSRLVHHAVGAADEPAVARYAAAAAGEASHAEGHREAAALARLALERGTCSTALRPTSSSTTRTSPPTSCSS